MNRTLSVALLLLVGPLVLAGDLNPTAPPGPTTPEPHSWSEKLPVAERFQLIWGNAAVLDRETGLVWERSPAQTPAGNLHYQAETCFGKALGGRYGFRVSTVDELFSLLDPAVTAAPHLPAGHPFLGNLSQLFLASGRDSWLWDRNNGYDPPVRFAAVNLIGTTPSVIYVLSYPSQSYVWCVRGPST